MNIIFLGMVRKILEKYDPAKEEIIKKKLDEIAKTNFIPCCKPSVFAGSIIYLAMFETKDKVTSTQIETFLLMNGNSGSRSTIMNTVYRIRKELRK